MNPLLDKYNKSLQHNVLIGLCLLLILLCGFAFSVNYSRNGFNYLATMDLFLIFMYLICLYFIHKQGVRSWSKALVAYSYVVVILAITTLGRLDAGMLNWAFTIPLMFYVLYAKKYAVFTSFFVMSYQIVNLYYAETYGQVASFLGVPNFFLAYILIWLLADIYVNQNNQIRKEVLALASQDPLTGARNRLSLEQFIESNNHSAATSLCLLDLDYFKKINDTHGHGVGDQVLILLVEVVSEHTSQEHVYRVGGEEFVIIFNDELAIATKKTEEILASFTQRSNEDLHKELALTFSAGVVCLEVNDSLSDVLKRADHYLYEAKESGRNKVVNDLS